MHPQIEGLLSIVVTTECSSLSLPFINADMYPPTFPYIHYSHERTLICVHPQIEILVSIAVTNDYGVATVSRID